jgi:peroxiredoxin
MIGANARMWTPATLFNFVKEVLPMVAFGRTSVADKTQTLKVGDQAPDFELPGHRGGETFKLSDLRGKKNAVLVFYPLDWTPV